MNHVSFESESDDADECNELLADLEDLLEIVSGLENVRSVTSSQTAAKKKMRTGQELKPSEMLLLGFLQLQTSS